MMSSEHRLDKILNCLRESGNEMKKWSKILIDSNRLYKGYGVATDKYNRLVEKGEYWAQEALDAIEQTTFQFERTINQIERALSKAEHRLHDCKGTLPTERFLFHKLISSVKKFRNNTFADNAKIADIIGLQSQFDKKWKQAEGIAKWDRAAVESYQRKVSPPINLVQLKDSAGISAYLSINAESALAMHNLVKERELIHEKGMAKERIESDQWQDLQENKKNMHGVPQHLGALQKKLVKILSHTLTFELAELLTRKIVPQLNSELAQELIDKVARVVPKRVAHDVTSGLTGNGDDLISSCSHCC